MSKTEAYSIVMSLKQDNATVAEFAEVIENKRGELEDALAIKKNCSSPSSWSEPDKPSEKHW